jgi:signal transduction histidine kinase
MKANQELLTDQNATYYTQLAIIPTFIILSFSAILFFSNRFLTKFVFKKIKHPLDMLSNGVHQIREGNLKYTIVYSESDEFKLVCEDFNDMAAQLKASIDEVKKNEQHRNELLAGISHDLRSPLTSIKAFVEGLLDGVAQTPDTQREYLRIIQQKTDDINNMVSQLFYYSKMEMGNYPTYPENLNAAKEIHDFVSASQEEYKSKGLTIKLIELPENIQICVDPLQLRSVFANILGNSAKYKDKETAIASIKCTLDNGTVRIIFEDDGPGVPDDALLKIFDVFYRCDLSRNEPHQGSGLGLAIALKAVERMDGRIYAENIESGGLRIIVEIPKLNGVQPQ